MNKLLHRDQLSVMFVGGPNRREDFHLEEGSEFFFQLRGDMELPTLQAGRRELVRIREGEVYLLPSRIPHSPQRPDAGSIGLVVERRRSERELDGLRFYTDFEACDAVLWEQYFHCSDLGKDLAPVLAAFRESEEAATRRPSATSVLASPPLKQDVATVVPPPFRRLAASGMRLDEWLEERSALLDAGATLPLFGESHPDKEFGIFVAGGPVEHNAAWRHETWLLQLRGEARVSLRGGEEATLSEGSCLVVPAKTEYTVRREAGSRGLVVTNDPNGNKVNARGVRLFGGGSEGRQPVVGGGDQAGRDILRAMHEDAARKGR
ncbi:hypothetical protein EMIHUDRAFT_214467 [Emiliania huxleyi CCMP1516]|nr:hypothetical protein EMIHUDRAFT_214467 [Emiliania huxleyi CCMP1516]EOD11614.1 hypothetical protein EMIHUDRAFT_214467 [Emiliania huxleyi CCMP1516]|eukprot:XP_005764043.1 hypothetical protein EMIHUDRAFT_214467 [Emiliania huxleyi CCMP1516]